MAGNFNQAHENSKSDFWQSVQPILEQLLHPCKIILMESRQDSLAKYLDVYCGIDAFIISHKDKNVTPLASRIQKDKDYQTFTVRNKRDSGTTTEYFKLLKAEQKQTLRPILTLQAYVGDGKLLSMALAQTSDILDYIKKGYAYTKHTSEDEIGGAEFFTVAWDKFARYYPLVKIFSTPGGYRRKDYKPCNQSLFD